MSLFQKLFLLLLGLILVAVATLIALVLVRPTDIGSQAVAVSATKVIAPLEFHGNNAVVLGPLGLEDGIYVATGIFSALASIKIVPITGECTGNGVNGYLFLNVDDYSKTPKQAVVTTKGCTALFEVTAGADWQFELKPVAR